MKGMKEELFWKRFWGRVDKSAGPKGCWLWTGARTEDGYGYLRKEGKIVRAHRVSWWFHNKKEVGEFKICHSCDNPPCVNWDHLFRGTNMDNSRDMWKKGRGAFGVRSGVTKLTDAQVIEIHRLLRCGIRVTDVSRHYKLHYSTIDKIAKGKQWKHVGVVQLKKKPSHGGVRCPVIYDDPPKNCLLTAVTKVTYRTGEVVYLCSGHALAVVSNSASLRGIRSIEAL